MVVKIQKNKRCKMTEKIYTYIFIAVHLLTQQQQQHEISSINEARHQIKNL